MPDCTTKGRRYVILVGMATSQLHNSQITVTRRAMSKVPEVTAYFWIVKVLTTGMGETTSDYLAHRLNPIVAVALAGILLAASLAVQFGVRRYVAWIYWTSITMVSVFGTMAADVLHVALGIPYVISTAFFLVALAAIFAIWYASEKTLSIHSIVTRRRELFYWATVMTTFALGTATGDMTAVTVHLGYLASGVMFAVLIALPALAYLWLRMNAVLTFWFAYVLTRPLGASFADWMGVPRARGGLALGTGPVSLFLAVIIVGFVGYLTVTRKDAAR
ncbi:membrane protein [Actinoallomurus vinaceus]|uniref:Membrane protein n=2 Tax=Actinoallomurus vinaceus TaxID=1080074 RepID=A0ABP8UGZ7_9ACTN